MFQQGKKIHQFPLKTWFRISEGSGAILAGVGASKKSLRLAHQRNRAKRLIREAFRLNKPALQQSLLSMNKDLEIFWLYNTADVLKFDDVLAAMEKSISKLIVTIRENN